MNRTALIALRRIRLFFGLLFILTVLLIAPHVVSAQSTSSIAQSFPADMRQGQITPGSLVSLQSDSHQIELATSRSADRLTGVADQKPLVVISAETPGVQVVLSGSTTALVSDINGPIKAGDKITISPIAGIGMAARSDSRVVGTAQADFDTSKSKSQTINDIRGKSHTIHIGYVPIQVGLAYYQTPGSFLPPFIQSFANTVAGKQVSMVRIVFCAILIFFSFISLAILIYTTVRAAMISLGRNPLAAPNIRKSLYQMGGVVVAIIVGTLVACYFVLVI